MPRWIPISVAAAVLVALGLWKLQSDDPSVPVNSSGSHLIAKGPQPIQAQPVGLRRLAAGESALSASATTIEELQEEARLRAALQPGGAQAASQHRGIH
jgi:hypothetical protein